MTYAPPTLKALAAYWVAQGGVNLGVVGDTRHVGGGTSYHLGKSALTPTAYSRRTARDAAGLTEAASAIDLGRLGGSLPKMRAFSVWLVERARADAPGTADLREIIYSPDGKTVYGWSREAGVASAPIKGYGDASHIGHTHISFYRDSERRDKVGLFRPYFETVPQEEGSVKVTSSTPMLIDLPIGTQLYAPDGATPVVKLSSGGTGIYSPCGGPTTAQRYVVITTGGVTQLLVVRTLAGATVHPYATSGDYNAGVVAASIAALTAKR